MLKIKNFFLKHMHRTPTAQQENVTELSDSQEELFRQFKEEQARIALEKQEIINQLILELQIKALYFRENLESWNTDEQVTAGEVPIHFKSEMQTYGQALSQISKLLQTMPSKINKEGELMGLWLDTDLAIKKLNASLDKLKSMFSEHDIQDNEKFIASIKATTLSLLVGYIEIINSTIEAIEALNEDDFKESGLSWSTKPATSLKVQMNLIFSKIKMDDFHLAMKNLYDKISKEIEDTNTYNLHRLFSPATSPRDRGINTIEEKPSLNSAPQNK